VCVRGREEERNGKGCCVTKEGRRNGEGDRAVLVEQGEEDRGVWRERKGERKGRKKEEERESEASAERGEEGKEKKEKWEKGCCPPKKRRGKKKKKKKER
jgi:hypothetical protein